MFAVKVGTEFQVSTQTFDNVRNPTIAGLANGNFVVSWQDVCVFSGINTRGCITAQLYDQGGAKIGSEFEVENEDGGVYKPAITGLANGFFVVSWEERTSTRSDINAQVFDAAGEKIGFEFRVNTETRGNFLQPTITGLATGGFVVSWVDYSVNSSSIKAQVFTAYGDKLGFEFLVNAETAGNQSAPSITALTNGGFVVSWVDGSGTLGDTSASGVKAQLFDANSVKQGSAFLVNTQTNGSQGLPAITGLSNGGFVVSWTDYSGTLGDVSGSNIKAQLFDAFGEKIGSEILVNTETVKDQYDPSITSLSNGGFVVSWSDENDPLFGGFRAGESIKAQLFDEGGAKIGSELRVDINTGGTPTITGLANGGFVVSWEDPAVNGEVGGQPVDNGNNSSIRAQIYSLRETNAAPVISSNGGGETAAISVTENVLAVTTVQASDGDADAIRYAIEGGADAALFSIDATSGVLSFLTASNFEAPADAGSNNVYDVIVAASDDNASDTQALSLIVTDIIEPGNTITGTGANDTINTRSAPAGQPKATAFDDLIFGLGGNDTIDGGAGADQMHGGTGTDTFVIDNAADQIIELAGQGTDTMKSAVVDLTLAANVEKGLVTGLLDLDITGNELANTLTGNARANVLRGGEGKDILNGNDGQDELFGDGGNDTLNGGNGNDSLSGGAGIDLLTGGAGSDILTGGSEADQFKFDKFMLADGLSATDTITDFSGFGGDRDRINLSAIDANGNAGDGNQKFAFIGTAAFGGVAGQLRYEQLGGVTRVLGDTDGDGIADFQIDAVGTINFSSGDFIL